MGTAGPARTDRKESIPMRGQAGAADATPAPCPNDGQLEPPNMKILLAVDGSEFTKRMLDYLSAHPGLFDGNAEFTALTVSAPINPAQVMTMPIARPRHRKGTTMIIATIRVIAIVV